MKASAPLVMRRLRAEADPARATHSLRFFRTGPGEYGEGDKFLGLTVPQIRAVAKDFAALPLEETDQLLDSEWHEARLVAVILLANQYAKAKDEMSRRRIYEMYLDRTQRINNWDLVDVSAPGIVGAHLMKRSRAVLRRLAKSRLLWDRRIAIVSTLYFITKGEFDDTLELALVLRGDKHDLIHKATGWMLREVGKRDENVLRRFLDKYAGTLPRTTLRYAIERLPVGARRMYMKRS